MISGTHKPRIKQSGTLHLPHNEIVLNKINENILLSTETWHNVQESWIYNGITEADEGYVWVKKWEKGKQYTIRKSFDAAGKLVCIYVDICAPITVENSVFEFEDWYLDVWYDTENKKVEIVDKDEFEKAVQEEFLSKEQAQQAREIAEYLQQNLLKEGFIDF
jgi:predicted RNA-binding protein associated with RNAse of E/G family